MSKFFFDSIQDANQKLASTVVMAKGLPCYIETVQGLNTDQQAKIYWMPLDQHRNDSEILRLDKETFEVKRLPSLGYVNHRNYSHYLSRRPVRQAVQGLNSRNVHIPGGDEGTPNWDAMLYSRDFADMLMNKYISFDRVFDEILTSQMPLKKAFSRTFAMSIDDLEAVYLWNRGVKVAVANNPKKYGPVFKVPQKYKYLNEELTEQRISLEAA